MSKDIFILILDREEVDLLRNLHKVMAALKIMDSSVRAQSINNLPENNLESKDFST